MPEERSRDKERMRVVREIALLKTLAVTICAFLICWLPYGIVVLFFADTVPPQVKKVITNVCLGDNTFCFDTLWVGTLGKCSMISQLLLHFIHQVALARRQRRDLSVFESNCHLPTCLQHTVEASHCPCNC